jgi:hypothetical protein
LRYLFQKNFTFPDGSSEPQWLDDQIIDSHASLVAQRMICRRANGMYLGTWFLQLARTANTSSDRRELEGPAKRLTEDHFGRPIEWDSLEYLIAPLSWQNTHWALAKFDVSSATKNSERVAELWDSKTGSWIKVKDFRLVVKSVNNLFKFAWEKGHLGREIKFKMPNTKNLRQLPTVQTDSHSCSVLMLAAAQDIAKSDGGDPAAVNLATFRTEILRSVVEGKLSPW